MTEHVLTVRREDHFDGEWPQGLTCFDDDAHARAVVEAFESSARFLDRELAEDDPTHKQLIPYCALRCGDEVFCVERLAAQGEARLHGFLSIGIGGHINPEDTGSQHIADRQHATDWSGASQDVVFKALRRELNEEAQLPPSLDLQSAQLIGLINDDSTAVGSVHVGLAFVIELSPAQARQVRIREISKMRGAFRRLVGSDGLWQNPRLLESWSRFMVGGFALGMADSEHRTQLEGD